MRKTALLYLLLLIFGSTMAQDIYLEFGKTSSNFNYTDSQGETLDNLQAGNSAYMSAGFSNKLFNERLKWSLGANYSSYGVLGSIGSVDNYLEWDINYLEFDFALNLTLFKIKKAAIYIKGITSSGFLLRGTQVINNSVFNLRETESFSKGILNFKGGIGFTHPISQNVSFFIQDMYGKSADIEKGSEKLKIQNNNLSFGLIINLAQQTIDKSEIN